MRVLMYSKTYLYPDMKWTLYMVEILSDGLDQEDEVTVMTLLRVMDVVPFDKWPFQKRIRLLLCSNGGKKGNVTLPKDGLTLSKKAWKLCLSLFSLLSDPQCERSRRKRGNQREWKCVILGAVSLARLSGLRLRSAFACCGVLCHGFSVFIEGVTDKLSPFLTPHDALPHHQSELSESTENTDR